MFIQKNFETMYFSQKDNIRVVELKGNPYEIGYQHGIALKDEIQYFNDNFENLICLFQGKIKGKLFYRLMLKTAKDFEKKILNFYPESKEFFEEMKGISDASHVPYEKILLFNLTDEISTYYIGKSMRKSCSSFVFRNKDGSLIIGRNLDYGVFIDELPLCTTIFKYYPEKGNSFIAISWPALVGSYTGISDNLFVSINVSQSKRKEMGAPEFLLTRKIIQYSNNLDDPLINAPYTFQGLNVLVSDKNNAVILEISPKMKYIRDLRDKGFLIATNHYQHPEMISEQAQRLVEEMPIPLKDGSYVHQIDTREREKIIREKIEKVNNIDVEYAKEILKSVSTRLTLQSIIYLPRERKLFIAQNIKSPVTYGTWEEFNI